MTRAYRGLVFGILAAVLLATLLARLPKSPSRDVTTAAPAAAETLKFEFTAEGVTPERAQVPVGRRLQLVLKNRAAHSLRIALAGYEDRVSVSELASGASWSAEIVADRPGEAFAWLVNGEPLGRLTVSGSHLVEGHR
jgi:hypothetical protein